MEGKRGLSELLLREGKLRESKVSDEKSFFYSAKKASQKCYVYSAGKTRHNGSINNSSLFSREVRRHARRIGRQMNTFREKNKEIWAAAAYGLYGALLITRRAGDFHYYNAPKNPRCPARMGRPTSLPKPITHLVFSLVERYTKIPTFVFVLLFWRFRLVIDLPSPPPD